MFLCGHKICIKFLHGLLKVKEIQEKDSRFAAIQNRCGRFPGLGVDLLAYKVLLRTIKSFQF